MESRSINNNESIVLREEKVERKPCAFYVKRKQRGCRLDAMAQQDFCPEHLVLITSHIENDDLKRILCPLDSAHSCFEKDLDLHLTRCNSRPKDPEVYFSKGINSDCIIKDDTEGGDLTLPNLSTEQLGLLVNKVRSIHRDFVPKIIPKKFGIHPSLGSQMVRTDIGDHAMKHLVQNASLLSLLDENNLLQDSTSFIEFGSGKGALSFWLSSVVCENENQGCHFVLLDRKSHRHKKDNKLKYTDLEIKRIRIDIEDLKLDELPSVNETNHTVGITKHLCGRATDLALRCILQTNSQASKVSGLVLATCCHHQCSYESYAGKEQLEEWGFTKSNFKLLTGLSSWAVCGSGKTKFENVVSSEPEEITNPRYAALNLGIAERRKLGIQAKEILDVGRAMYIKSFGLAPTLIHYTDISTTYENVAIVATR